MHKRLLLKTGLLIFAIQILSCSHYDDSFNNHIIEIEVTVPDSTNDSTIVITNVKDSFVYSYSNYMLLGNAYGVGQGGTCFGKYFFQAYSGNSALGIYNLDNKTAIGKLDMPFETANDRIHANTICFGNQRLSQDDYFPLLYISSGYSQNINGSPCSFIYVYRISKYSNYDGTEGFHISFVQTITLKGFGSWTEGILDNEHNLLWIKYEPDGTDGEYRYASFHIPKLENGDITILREDFITDFSLGVQPFKSSNQGHLFNDNKILLVSGTSLTSQKLAFIIINTLTQTRELVLDLASIGLTNEPENLFYYNNQLMIGYRGAIYKFQLSPLSKN